MFRKILLLIGLCFVISSASAIEFNCRAEYGGESATLTVKPVSDPYRFETTDALGAFRFSAQYLSAQGKLKTYVYHYAKNRFVLIHAAEYSIAEANCQQYQTSLGKHRVYSAKLEKEFNFQCDSICASGLLK
jgi:hypothetical protein